MDKTLKGFSSKFLLLFILCLVGLPLPLPSLAQEASFPSEESSKSQGSKFNQGKVLEEKIFFVLKERLDHLSKQASKHKRPSGPKIPEYVGKENPGLPVFPEITEDDSLEDRLLMLKVRLETLHHTLQQEP